MTKPRLCVKTMLAGCAPLLILDIPNGIPDSLDAFGSIIGDVNVVFFLKFHDHFYGFERVRAQVGKSGISVDCAGGSTENTSVKLSYRID